MHAVVASPAVFDYALRSVLDSWSGIGHVAVGMQHKGSDTIGAPTAGERQREGAAEASDWALTRLVFRGRGLEPGVVPHGHAIVRARRKVRNFEIPAPEPVYSSGYIGDTLADYVPA